MKWKGLEVEDTIECTQYAIWDHLKLSIIKVLNTYTLILNVRNLD